MTDVDAILHCDGQYEVRYMIFVATIGLSASFDGQNNLDELLQCHLKERRRMESGEAFHRKRQAHRFVALHA